MKTSTILCTAVATTMGFGSLASAQDTRQDRREARQEARQELRQERQQDVRRERREDARERVEDRRERREDFAERREDRAERREDFRDGQRWVNPRAYNGPNYYPHYNQGYAPRYYGNAAPRFYRGGYLPYSYRQPSYYVNWRAYPNRLYAPPYGHQWVHVGDEVLLIALATGLIATTIAW